MAVYNSCLLTFLPARRKSGPHDQWHQRAGFRSSLLPLLFGLLLFCEGSAAQSDSPAAMENQIKAAYLYKFCLYTHWPNSSFSRMDAPFVFGVIAPVSFVRELHTVVKGRTINKRPVEIREIDDDDDLTGVHAIFLAGSQLRSAAQLRSIANGLPLLVVTESESGLEDGATINFTQNNNRISFDVALDEAQRQGLHLSAEMLKVAGNVRGGAKR